MPSTLPYAGAAGIAAIIDDLQARHVPTTQLERGVLRNVAHKTARAEKAQLAAFFNQLPPSDLARIGAAVSRLEKRAELTSLQVAMAQLKLNKIEDRRDLQSIRQLFTRRR